MTNTAHYPQGMSAAERIFYDNGLDADYVEQALKILRGDANKHDDADMVALCDEALAGDLGAVQACAERLAYCRGY